MLPAAGMANEMHRERGKGWKLKPTKQINDQMRNVCYKVKVMRKEKGDQESEIFPMNILMFKKQRKW